MKTKEEEERKASERYIHEDGGVLCPKCRGDRLGTEGFDIVDMTVSRKMYCEYCKNEWTEYYDLREITLDSDRRIPEDGKKHWLHGKETVCFEFPYKDDTIANQVMIVDFRHGDLSWWDSHNKALNVIDIEEDIDGMNSRGTTCRFTRVSFSYYRESAECRFDELRDKCVPEALLDEFKTYLASEPYHMEIVVCYETKEVDIYADPHDQKHMACHSEFGEETGNKYVHIYLKYPNTMEWSTDGFYCEDRDNVFELLRQHDICGDLAYEVQTFLENFFWCFQNRDDNDGEDYWLRYTGKSTGPESAQTDHYYKLDGIDYGRSNLYDAEAIVLVNGEPESYRLRDFMYEPESINLKQYTVGKYVVYDAQLYRITSVDGEACDMETVPIGNTFMKRIGYTATNIHQQMLRAVHHFVMGDNDTVFCLDINGYVLHRVYADHADRDDDDRRARFSINEYRIHHSQQWETDMYYGSPKSPMPIRYLDSFDRYGKCLDPIPGHYKTDIPWTGQQPRTQKERSVQEIGVDGVIRILLEQIEAYSSNHYIMGKTESLKENIPEIRKWLSKLKESRGVTFKEFQESRRCCASDSELYGGHSGSCFRYGDGDDEIAICGLEGKFWLLIGNQEWLSHNLQDLEIILYLWRHVENA
jgi:hypothetical protein